MTAWTSVARERTIATARTSGSGPGGGPSGFVDQDIANIDDAAYVRALAHPLRLKILAMLGERQSSPARLAAALGARVNVVAYHVRRLRELGIADLVEVRPGRGGLEHIYAVRRHPTFSDAAWEDLRPEARSRVVVAMLRQMSEYVARAALAGGFGRRDAHFTRTPLHVDQAGWEALAAAARDWLRAVAEIERDVAERGSDELFDAGLVVLLFEARPFSEGPAEPRARG